MFTIDSQSEGDTQPVSQSVYKEFASRRTEQLAAGQAAGSHEETIMEDATAMRSLHEGETGHIDLLGAFEQPSLDNEHADGEHKHDDTDPLSQPLDVRADLFPESQRFKEPKTPATNGKKRKRGAETQSQEDDSTLGLPVNPFAGAIGGVDGMMGPSQLFEATQALTSPLTNVVPSDGLSEMPSPAMHVLQRPSTADPLSSPGSASRLRTARAVTEPQTTYVSMKQSQEARERYLQSLKAAEILSADELSDDDFGSADTQLRRRSRQRRIDIETKNQFAGLTARASPRVSGQHRVRPVQAKNTPNRVGMRSSGKQRSEPVLISDDAPVEDTQGNITEDETEREEEVVQAEDYNDMDELAEENKENVEVPRTVARANHTTSQVVTSQSTPSRRNSRIAKGGSQSCRTVQVESSSQITKSQEPATVVEGAIQPDAIADSQTSQSRAKAGQNSKAQDLKGFLVSQSSLDPRVLVPQSQLSQVLQAPTSSEGRAEGNESSANPQSSPFRVQTAQATEALSRGLPLSFAASPHTAGPGGEHAGSEPASRSTQEPPASSAPHSNPVESRFYPAKNPAPAQSTIPETSPSSNEAQGRNESTGGFSRSMPSPMATPKSAPKVASSHSVTEQSRSSTLFETAQEQLLQSPSKSRSQLAQKASPGKHTSPTKKRLSRTISEIAADPTPPDVIGDVDVDINILSNEDIEFQKAISGSSPVGPARKRRRGRQGLALQVPHQEPSHIPAVPHSPLLRSFNSEPPGSSAISPITPHPTSEAERSSSAVRISATVQQAPTREGRTSEAKDPSAAKPPVTVQALSVLNKAEPSTTPNAASTPGAVTAREASSPPPLSALQTSVPSTDRRPSNIHPMTAPNRVFAHFNGSNPAYHPATCLEMMGSDDPRYRVRFEDGTIDVISGYSIKRLELRPGDVVKVDLPGARKLNYVVEAVQDQRVSSIARDPATPSRRQRSAPINDLAFPEVDVYGNATVLVSPKQRQSAGGVQPDSSQIAVPLVLVYLTQTMWTAFRDRQYIHSSHKLQTMTGLQTPSERPSTPSTPSSRTRRVKSSGLAQAHNITSDGIFRNMAFAITNNDRADENERIKKYISTNGGNILSTGLDELFHIPTLPRTTSPADPNADTSFHLTPAAKDVGFTCLIADKHCRTAKFIQALALGIPCLSARWITHCVAKQRVLPWSPYLLPSGESAFLGGAVRSRVLQPFDAEKASLSDIVENRPRMLNNASVLIIMEKGQEKSMQQHPLIAHALGARKISRAISDASAAKAAADAQALGEPWDWVFSYDKEQEVEEKMFGGHATGKKRKRGRDSDSRAVGKKGKTRVVGNEFVIQSLILGMLIEE